MYEAKNVYLICGFAAIGGGLFGFDISSMSGVLGTGAYKRYFHSPYSTAQGFITAAMPAGSLVGALASSFIADKYSRKVAIQVACVIFIIGAIIQSACIGRATLILGRAVSGVGVGIASTVVPIYQSEISPKEIRGRVVSLQQWAITWGILIQYFVQYGAAQIDGGPSNLHQSTAAFRIPWGIQTVPALILFFGLYFAPKSPRWLASKDRWEDAISIMAQLHGNGDMNHPKVLAEYKEIEEALRFEREEAVSSCKQLMQPKMFRRLLLGMSIQMWSQLSGMNILMYYVIYVMQATNMGSPFLTSAIQYIINVVLTLPAILYVDKWGRRSSLLSGSLVMMISMFIIGALEASYGSPVTKMYDDISWEIADNKTISWVLVILTYIFVGAFSMTWGPSSWTYPAEIYPSAIRAKAVSLTTASNWAWNCALAFAVPPLMWYINWRLYMIFATFNGLAFIHVFFTAPETKGKTLEEMDEVFDSGSKPWKAGRKGSRLDDLQRDIETGRLKVAVPVRRSSDVPYFLHIEDRSQSESRTTSEESGHTW